MPSSYRIIDYRLRPAKHVKRLMLCEAFRRLRFHALEKYHYVGLGSIYFADFRLIHRSLGITRMTSIEKDSRNKDRFEWNKPYAGINLLFGMTGQHLPSIDYSEPTILWLDYDGPLKRDVVEDIRTVVQDVSHGSVLVVTVNAQPRQNDEQDSDMLEQVRNELRELVPDRIKLPDLRGWGLAKLYRDVVTSQINEVLSIKNQFRQPQKRLLYQQLFNFQYKDRSQMATFGGVFYEHGKQDEYNACDFGSLSYVRKDKVEFRIEEPLLTLREIAHLERQLPLKSGSMMDYGSIPEKDANNYHDIYRYFSVFSPVDLV